MGNGSQKMLKYFNTYGNIFQKYTQIRKTILFLKNIGKKEFATHFRNGG